MFNFFKKKKEVEGEAKANYIGMDMDLGMDIINSGEDIYIVDARSVEEYTYSHIKGAINIPVVDMDMTEEDLDVTGILEDKEKKVLVYSAAEEKSKVLSRVLALLGFKHVCDIGDFAQYTGEKENA